MNRKWAALAATMAIIAGAGFSMADDDEKSELHKIMEKVQQENATILKGVRNKVMFRKSQKDVAKSAKELIELGKKAREENGYEGVEKGSKDDWTEKMDAFLKETESFSKIVEEEDADQSKAKDAYRDVARSCTACHDTYRPEDDDF